MECSETKYKNNLESAYDYAASQLMSTDRDLYRLTLYETDLPKRKALIALWALVTSLEQIPEQVTESQMGLLRFKWWYDTLAKGQADQTQLLIALEDSIESGLLDRETLLALVDHMQGDITLNPDSEAAILQDYQKQKGRLIAGAARSAQTNIFESLSLARAARHQPRLLEGTAEIDANKDGIFAAKTAAYTRILMQKIKRKKHTHLSPLDLIKLHFC